MVSKLIIKLSNIRFLFIYSFFNFFIFFTEWLFLGFASIFSHCNCGNNCTHTKKFLYRWKVCMKKGELEYTPLAVCIFMFMYFLKKNWYILADFHHVHKWDIIDNTLKIDLHSFYSFFRIKPCWIFTWIFWILHWIRIQHVEKIKLM